MVDVANVQEYKKEINRFNRWCYCHDLNELKLPLNIDEVTDAELNRLRQWAIRHKENNLDAFMDFIEGSEWKKFLTFYVDEGGLHFHSNASVDFWYDAYKKKD